jgi:guanine deaminase
VHDWGDALILPGLIDTHVHLPQLAYAGLGGQPLLQWLNEMTFPTEARFADASFAERASERFFSSLLAAGTTSAAVYLTVFEQAGDLAFQAAAASGIRAWMGKPLMDIRSPEALCESTAEALASMQRLIDRWHGVGLLRYVVTPRFALSCTPELMRQAGEMARHHQCLVQTHLAENLDEVAAIADAFPQSEHYTAVYRDHGLLDKALLAHCLHLDDAELGMIKHHHGCVVHCPASNRFLQSGVFDAARMRSAGIDWSLGSDVGAGYGPSMLKEMREAMETAKTSALFGRESSRMELRQALAAATRQGARALGMEQELGALEKGFQADFIVLDDAAVNEFAGSRLFQSPQERLQRVVYRENARAVQATWVAGRLRYSRH